MSKKPLLFYSLYCDHSKGVLSYINRKGLKSSFLLVSVDKHSHSIPSFIVKVPCIYTGDKVLSDDDVAAFIDVEANKNGQDVPVNAYYDKEMGNSISDSFSYIDSESIDVERSFANVGNTCAILGDAVPKEDDFTMGSKTSEMDSFKSEREKDLANIFSSIKHDVADRPIVR